MQTQSELEETAAGYGSGGKGLEEQLLQEMMKQFTADGADAGGGFEEMLQSMMGQLMSKEILYEPLQDLSKKVSHLLISTFC